MQEVLRYEIKFPLSYEQYCCLEHRLYQNIPNLLSPYPERVIHSLYYDDYVMSDYHNNVSGITPREKVRLRWYNDDKNAALELKYRDGQMGLKKSVPLDVSIEQAIQTGIQNTNLPDDLLNSWERRQNQSLYVRYNRKYFALENGIRLTIDWNIEFASNIDNPLTPSPVYCVLEVKFPSDKQEDAAKIIQSLGYRYYRHSKYVIGMDTLYF